MVSVKSGKWVLKKEWCSLLLWSFMALFRVQIIHLTIQDDNKKKKQNSQKVRNKWVQNRDGGHDVWEAVFMLQGFMFTYQYMKTIRENLKLCSNIQMENFHNQLSGRHMEIPTPGFFDDPIPMELPHDSKLVTEVYSLSQKVTEHCVNVVMLC